MDKGGNGVIESFWMCSRKMEDVVEEGEKRKMKRWKKEGEGEECEWMSGGCGKRKKRERDGERETGSQFCAWSPCCCERENAHWTNESATTNKNERHRPRMIHFFLSFLSLKKSYKLFLVNQKL